VVRVTPGPRFIPRGKNPRYPLYRKLGGPGSGPDTEAAGKVICLWQRSKRNSVRLLKDEILCIDVGLSEDVNDMLLIIA
jgi:hypothetical protein